MRNLFRMAAAVLALSSPAFAAAPSVAALAKSYDAPLPQQIGRFFTMRATVRVKKPFLPFAPGVTKSRLVDGDENVVETEIADPVDFPVVLAGNYRYAEETREGMTVRVASYAMSRPNSFKKLKFGTTKNVAGLLGFLTKKDYMPFFEANYWGMGLPR